AGPANESYSYTAPDNPGGRLCTTECGHAQDACMDGCLIQQRQCTTHVQAQALIDYEKYMSEQFLHAGAIELRPRDFERMAPCDEDLRSCKESCARPYRSCYESCGGAVSRTTSCKFLCF